MRWECVYVVFLSSFFVRSPAVDVQIFQQDVEVKGHEKQSTRHDIFSRGHVVARGLDFGGKIFPSEMHGTNCNHSFLGNGAS